MDEECQYCCDSGCYGECKCNYKFDASLQNDTFISTDAATFNLLSISQGANYDQRIANRIRMKRIQVKGYVARRCATINVGTTLFNSSYMKIALIYDKQHNFSSGAAGIATVWNSDQPSSFLNPLYENRFILLWEKCFVTAPYVISVERSYMGENIYTFEIDLDVDLLTTFKGTSNALTDICSGALFLYAISDVTASTPSGVEDYINFCSLVKYCDE